MPFIEVASVLVFAAFLSSRRVSLLVGVWCTVVLVSLFVVVDFFAGAYAIFSFI